MIGIIQDWLFNQLGMYFNFDHLEEGNSFQDGSVFANILTNYGLLNSNVTVNIIKGWDQEIYKKNLTLLKPIFDMLNVSFDNNVMLDIISNNKIVIITLLYELYIRLENKQHLYFITQEKFDKVQKSYINSLNKDGNLLSEVETEILTKNESICFKKPLVNNRDLVEWYKERFKRVESSINSRLHSLQEPLINKKSLMCFNSVKKKHRCPCSCATGSGDQELVAYLPDMDMFHASNSYEKILDHKQFVASFKAKRHRNSAKECFEKNVQNELLKKTWSTVMEKQNEMYNSIFSQIMLKQSHYEKQILTKLIQTQKQIKIENENIVQTSSKVLDEEEKQLRSDFELKEEFEQFKTIYENEQKRVLELHTKLYRQKQDLAKKKHYDLCVDVLDSIIDLAVSASEYQSKFGVPVPMVLWNSWKQYFYKSQPIYIPFQTLERSIFADEICNYDDIIDFEKQSSFLVNENDINEYLLTCGQWFYENICKDYVDINENVLGFIIYRLLSLKYPPPQSPLPAQLPTFRIAGVLLDFYNSEYIEKLKTLLSKPSIHVFDQENVIKTCISKFEEEVLSKKNVETLNQSIPNNSEKNKKRKKEGSFIPKKGKAGDKPGKKKKRVTETDETKEDSVWITNKNGETINLINKETQTSIVDKQTITKEITIISPLGMIGEQVFNILKEGQKVEDELLVKAIIEYIKTLEGYDGWVLLNYPNTINQASILELALSGKRLPLEDYILEDENLEVEENWKDENAIKRHSKILPSPEDGKIKSPFKSYFTIFVKVKPNITKQSEHPAGNNYKDDFLLENNRVEESESNTSIKDREIILPDILEKVYKQLSIHQDFYIESYDLVVLKQLARIILNDDRLKPTASLELFGKETLEKLSKSSKKENKNKILTLNKNKKSDKSKMNKKKQSDIDGTITEEKILVTEDNTSANKCSLDMEQTNNTIRESLQVKIIKPGDDEWQFVGLSLDENIVVILATVWENLEKCYLQNLEDIFFENRLINLRLVPYTAYVKNIINAVATKPDVRQDLVNQFQKYFMNLDKDLRALPEIKNHFFCKVLEMQENLWQIIDDKKNEIESKRKEVIYENWLVRELCMLINNYLSLVQTEFDRSVGTLKLVSDYYLTMLDKTPISTISSQLLDSKVTKVTVDHFLLEPQEILQIIKDPEQISSFSSNSSNQSVKINIVAQDLIDCIEKERAVDIMNTFFSREVEHLSNLLKSVTHTFLLQIKAEEDILVGATKKMAKGKNISGKIKKSEELKSVKSRGEKKLKILTDVNSDKISAKNLSKNGTFDDSEVELDKLQKEALFNEWKFVVNTELERFNFRMDLISSRAQENIMEFYYYIESVFCEMLRTNLSKYDLDITNTNRLCDYLRTAIEEESSLKYPLVLKRSEFFIDITQNLTKEHEYDEVKELYKNTQDSYFTINQLKILMGIFKIAGPHGVIRKEPFSYILQDLMLFNDKYNQPHLPRIWNLLNESQLLNVLEGMFSSEYSINWRDFLIYNLEIPFPSPEEILIMRNKFLTYDLENTEILSTDVYNSIDLWFEQDLPNNPQEGLRFALIKELLSEMFQIKEGMINYTALLLYFCKDHDPTVGLKKALCLAIGKNVITSEKELNEILKEEAEIKVTVVNLLENIINSIVYSKEATLIYEVSDSVTDFDVDFTETNYNVSENSESEYSSFYSENSSSRDGVENNFQKEKQSLFSKKSLPNNRILSLDKTWVSKIPIATIISVLNASFIHQDESFSLRNQYLNCLEEYSDKEGLIEAHVLVTSDCINKLFKLSNKFKIISPHDILENCVKK